jgi:hypothetical protein
MKKAAMDARANSQLEGTMHKTTALRTQCVFNLMSQQSTYARTQIGPSRFSYTYKSDAHFEMYLFGAVKSARG